MPLFCLRRPEEWWGILQVCTRLSHLQPKRSIVWRLHKKFQEVWHFVSQTPGYENKNFLSITYYQQMIQEFLGKEFLLFSFYQLLLLLFSFCTWKGCVFRIVYFALVPKYRCDQDSVFLNWADHNLAAIILLFIT